MTASTITSRPDRYSTGSAMAGAFMGLHRVKVTLRYVLIGLRILGALKHAFSDRDDTLRCPPPILLRKP